MPPKERKLSMQSRQWHPRVGVSASCPVTALFTLTLFHRGRVVHGATCFGDACQPPRNGFPRARCQDSASRSVNNCMAWHRQMEQTPGEIIYRRRSDRLQSAVHWATVCSSVSNLCRHRTWSRFAVRCAAFWSGCSGFVIPQHSYFCLLHL